MAVWRSRAVRGRETEGKSSQGTFHSISCLNCVRHTFKFLSIFKYYWMFLGIFFLIKCIPDTLAALIPVGGS